GPGSFRRVVDVPFQTCVAALGSWQRTEQGGEVRFGESLLCGPVQRDPGSATRRIQVRLARGALRPLLRMRLDIDRWSSSSTAVELIPCRLVRPTAGYFQAGRFLLDSLTRSLPHRPEPWITLSSARLNIDLAAVPSPDVSNKPSNNRPRQQHMPVDVR